MRQTGVGSETAGAHAPVARFLQHLATARRLSVRTVEAYRADLAALARGAGETALASLGGADIRRILASCHARGLSGRSIARMLSAWRGFYRYLAQEGLCGRDPCAGLRAPRSAKRLPAALSPDQARRLVEVRGDGALRVRDRAMLELFYSSGLRLSELAALDWPLLDFAQGTVRVLGKGGKTRVVPVGSAALQALRAWREHPARQPVEPAAVFVDRRGKRLTGRAIQLRVRRLGAERGIETRVHPHVLRHSFASHVLQSSGDLRAVQEMLGHASIGTTQVYTHLDFQHLAKVYDAAHPRARKKRR